MESVTKGEGVAITRTEYAGWEHCLHLTNGYVDLICTLEVGPRIVHVATVDGPNLCYLDSDAGTVPDDDEWHLFGGHRCWHAPEITERTKQPDNDPVDVTRHDDGVTLAQPTESTTGIRKELTVRLARDAPEVAVTHRLVNEGEWPIEIAPWGITVMEPGGTAVLPIAERGEGRQADRSVALWPYTDLSDDRFAFGDDAVLVGGDPDRPETKLGVDGADGWAAYVLDGQALRKEFHRDPAADYPDRGAAAQVFTNGALLELETLGPLERVGRGEATTHVEEWTVLSDVDDSGMSPAEAVETVAPE